MQVLIILFDSGLELDRIAELFRSRADKYEAVEGLLQKYYVRDAATGRVGGIYVFDSEASLEAFTHSELARSIGDAYQQREPATRMNLDVLLALRPIEAHERRAETEPSPGPRHSGVGLDRSSEGAVAVAHLKPAGPEALPDRHVTESRRGG